MDEVYEVWTCVLCSFVQEYCVKRVCEGVCVRERAAVRGLIWFIFYELLFCRRTRSTLHAIVQLAYSDT